MLELQNQLKIFVSTSQGRGDNCLQHSGHSIRQLLLEKSNSYRAQDVFRHLNGFQAILVAFDNILRILHESDIQGSDVQQSDIQEFDVRESDIQESNIQETQDLIQTIFGVLTAALQDHRGNQKYFRQCCPGGGWKALRGSFELLIEYLKERNLAFSEVIIERLFGCLLSCATNDDTMAGFFGKLRRHLQSVPSPKTADIGK